MCSAHLYIHTWVWSVKAWVWSVKAWVWSVEAWVWSVEAWVWSVEAWVSAKTTCRVKAITNHKWFGVNLVHRCNSHSLVTYHWCGQSITLK